MMEDLFNERKQMLDLFKSVLPGGKSTQSNSAKIQIPEGLYTKCPDCGEDILTEALKNNMYVCPKCSCHLKMPAYERILSIVDKDSFKEMNRKLEGSNVLDFEGYEEKIQQNRDNTGLNEAVVTGIATIKGIKVVLGVMDSRFFMASMGSAVGEKITRAFEYAAKKELPVIMFTASGGARMQEGIVSLMQMSKTSSAVAKHSQAGQLYIACMTNPTTGGVTASFASLGDIMLAEPNALIGFAGPRVIEQTIKQKLPEGFQRAEFQQEHGFIDAVVHRHKMRATLGKILSLHEKGGSIR